MASKEKFLLDTGPLVAVLDKGDQNHEKARELFRNVQTPLLTCEAVVSEACHLLGKKNKDGPAEVVRLGQNGLYVLPVAFQKHLKEIILLLEKYEDQYMSYADACLVQLATIYKTPHIVTFDSDFDVYRWDKRKAFQVVQ